MVKIGVTTFGCDGGKSGLSQYLINLLREWNPPPSDIEMEILAYEDETDIFIPHPSPNLKILPFKTHTRPAIKNLCWHQFDLPRLVRQREYDVLFLPAANRRIPYFSKCPTVGTFHDLSSLHVQEKYDSARMFYLKKVLPRLVRRLRLVLTISESSKKDLLDFVKIPENKIVVIPEAADLDHYFPKSKEESRQKLQEKYQIKSPYFLFISRIEHPGKNHVRLIEAFNQVKAQKNIPHQLVFVGGDWGGAEKVKEKVHQSPFQKDILFTGFVPTSELPDFYRGADLFIFPSLYEGFGLPILEAMACGTPVLCSNNSSLPEVAGEAALFFDPYQEKEMAEQILKAVNSSELLEDLSKRGTQQSQKFSWKTTAEKTLESILSTV